MKNHAQRFDKTSGSKLHEKEQFDYLFSLKSKGRVLEIGPSAGTERTLAMYRDKSFETNVVRNTGLALALSFEDESFDYLIVPLLGLAELAPLHFSLSEIERVLKQDGRVYIHALSSHQWPIFFKTAGLEIEKSWGSLTTRDFDPSEDSSVSYILKKTTAPKPVIQEVYDTFSGEYESVCKGDHYKVAPWLRTQLPKLNISSPRWLDVGCGTGLVGDIIHEVGLTVSFLGGLDISPQMLRECKKKNRYHALGRCDLNYGLVETKLAMFNVITAVGVLEFAPDLSKVLRDFFNLLIPGGCVYITLEKKEEKATLPDFFVAKETKIFRKQYTAHEIQGLTREAGFLVDDIHDGPGYTSPTSGNQINYLMVSLKKA